MGVKCRQRTSAQDWSGPATMTSLKKKKEEARDDQLSQRRSHLKSLPRRNKHFIFAYKPWKRKTGETRGGINHWNVPDNEHKHPPTRRRNHVKAHAPRRYSDGNFFESFICLAEQIFQSEVEFNLAASGRPVSAIAVAVALLFLLPGNKGDRSAGSVQPLCTLIKKGTAAPAHACCTWSRYQ